MRKGERGGGGVSTSTIHLDLGETTKINNMQQPEQGNVYDFVKSFLSDSTVAFVASWLSGSTSPGIASFPSELLGAGGAWFPCAARELLVAGGASKRLRRALLRRLPRVRELRADRGALPRLLSRNSQVSRVAVPSPVRRDLSKRCRNDVDVAKMSIYQHHTFLLE